MSERPAAEVQRVPYRWIARVAVLIGLAAFVLPFATVSCGGQKVLTATGLNGITGSQYTVSGRTYSYSGDVSLLLAVLGGVVALTILFLLISARAQAIATALASLWSVAMLLVGQAHLNSELADGNLGSSVVTVRWEPGFWIALAAFAVAAVVMALQLYSVRAAPAGQSLWPDVSLSQTSRSLVITASGIAAAAGSLLIILACFLPYIHYTDSSIQPSSPSILNPGFGPSNWFAVEPVGVAVLAFIAAVVLVIWRKRFAAIAAFVVLAYGVQTTLLFAGYVFFDIRSDSAQLGSGSVVGMIAGLLLAASGLAAALSLIRRQPATPEEEPHPAGAS